jgi:hypothetical protein
MDPNPIGGLALPVPLSQIQLTTYGTTMVPPGAALPNGASFVFVLVGNPALPPFPDGAAGQFNLRSAHFPRVPVTQFGKASNG